MLVLVPVERVAPLPKYWQLGMLPLPSWPQTSCCADARCDSGIERKAAVRTQSAVRHGARRAVPMPDLEMGAPAKNVTGCIGIVPEKGEPRGMNIFDRRGLTGGIPGSHEVKESEFRPGRPPAG
jgi:hypothetical protein